MKVWVYIDGFNLYNGAVRNTPYKWLDLLKFSQNLLLSDQIERVKYFTARIVARASDPDQGLRQIAYWRALRTLGCIDIIEGHFLSGPKRMAEAASVQNINSLAASGVDVSAMRPTMVEVFKSEEKGTDVNLATHLVHDAHLNRFEAALVISNDSDLTEAIRLVKNEVGKVVGVYTPHANRPSVQLRNTASFFREIKTTHLRNSQFPDTLTDARGSFSKPVGW